MSWHVQCFRGLLQHYACKETRSLLADNNGLNQGLQPVILHQTRTPCTWILCASRISCASMHACVPISVSAKQNGHNAVLQKLIQAQASFYSFVLFSLPVETHCIANLTLSFLLQQF